MVFFGILDVLDPDVHHEGIGEGVWKQVEQVDFKRPILCEVVVLGFDCRLGILNASFVPGGGVSNSQGELEPGLKVLSFGRVKECLVGV